MVKSISTIYIDSAVLAEAKAQKVDISQICEEALRVTTSASVGTLGGAVGNYLNSSSEKTKSQQLLRKLRNKTGANAEFNRLLHEYANKYTEGDLGKALKGCGL